MLRCYIIKLMPKKQMTDYQIEHQKLVSLVNSLTDAVVSVDEHVHVTLFNAAALNILDVNTIKPGDSLDSIIRLTDSSGEKVSIKDLITGAKTQQIHRDYKLVYREDDYINLYLSIAPVHYGYEAGGIKGYVLLLRDITSEKSLEEERDEFISVISHELRTPLTIAEGNLGNALFVTSKTPNTDPSVSEALKQSYDQILLLAAMVNDLSTLSRAERGDLRLEAVDINAHELVNLLADEYRSQAAEKGLEMKWHADPQLQLLRSSKLYVREVLQNFLTNAIKYTDEGSITISAKQADDGVMFEVTDTGIGISKSDQKRVFDKFFRSEDFRTRQSKGTGLGLYVTMKLLRILKADISLHSELNKGSTFSIFVPNA